MMPQMLKSNQMQQFESKIEMVYKLMQLFCFFLLLLFVLFVYVILAPKGDCESGLRLCVYIISLFVFEYVGIVCVNSICFQVSWLTWFCNNFILVQNIVFSTF